MINVSSFSKKRPISLSCCGTTEFSISRFLKKRSSQLPSLMHTSKLSMSKFWRQKVWYCSNWTNFLCPMSLYVFQTAKQQAPKTDINDVQHDLTTVQTVSSHLKILRNNWPLDRCSLTLISFHWQIHEIPATSTKPSFSLLSGTQLSIVVHEHLKFSRYVVNKIVFKIISWDITSSPGCKWSHVDNWSNSAGIHNCSA